MWHLRGARGAQERTGRVRHTGKRGVRRLGQHAELRECTGRKEYVLAPMNAVFDDFPWPQGQFFCVKFITKFDHILTKNLKNENFPKMSKKMISLHMPPDTPRSLPEAPRRLQNPPRGAKRSKWCETRNVENARNVENVRNHKICVRRLDCVF